MKCQRLNLIFAALVMLAFTSASGQAASPPAPRLSPIVAAGFNPYANHSAGLRAAPLPRDTLSGFSPPMRAPYSVPYGPHFSRPPGSLVIPFGSSRYYYHR